MSTGGRNDPGVVNRSLPTSTIPSGLTIPSREIRAATCCAEVVPVSKNKRNKQTRMGLVNFMAKLRVPQCGHLLHYELRRAPKKSPLLEFVPNPSSPFFLIFRVFRVFRGLSFFVISRIWRLSRFRNSALQQPSF